MTQMPIVSEVLKRLVPSVSLSMIRVDESCAAGHYNSEFFDDSATVSSPARANSSRRAPTIRRRRRASMEGRAAETGVAQRCE
jgi:hypothetical protein